MIDKLLIFDLKGKLACWKKFYSNSSSFTYEIPTRTNLMGLLASILELPRDSYYELLSSNNCRVSLQIKSTFKKGFHCMNYFKKANSREKYTQVRLELLQPINIQNDFIVYRLFVWLRDNEKFDKLISRVKSNNQGFGVYFGQRQFRGNIEFVELVAKENIRLTNSAKSTDSILNISSLQNEEDLVFDNSDICIERMPLDFEFAEKDSAGNIDTEKLHSNYLNRELLKIGKIVYSKKLAAKINSKSCIKKAFEVDYLSEKNIITFYEEGA